MKASRHPFSRAAPRLTRSFSIIVNTQPHTITGFAPISPVVYAPAPNNTVTLAATGGDSGNPVTFASNTPAVCTIGGTNNNVVTLLTTGTCTLRADQAGNTNFSAATQATASITVDRRGQTITFTPATPISYQRAPNNTINLAGTTTSGLPITYASTTPTVCTVTTSTATATILTAGTCTITADQAGNDTVSPAPQVTASITINPATQTIIGFNPPTTISQAAASTLTLSATGGASGNPVLLASTTLSI